MVKRKFTSYPTNCPRCNGTRQVVTQIYYERDRKTGETREVKVYGDCPDCAYYNSNMQGNIR